MRIFNHSCHTVISSEIIHANNILFEIINSLEVIKGSHLLDNCIFVELCNDIPHIIYDTFSAIDTWTVGQKRGFLRHITQTLGVQSEFAPILSGIDSDVSALQEIALNTNIDKLKTNLEKYVENKRIERAKQHAACLGEIVATKLQDINENWLQSQPLDLKTKIQELYSNLKTWTALYEEERHTPAIIEEFLRKFADRNNGQNLESLFDDLPEENFKYRVDALEKVVFAAFEKQIQSVVYKQLYAEQDKGRLDMLLSQISENAEITAASIEEEFDLSLKALKNQMSHQLLEIQEQQEEVLISAIRSLKDYHTRIKEYSGLDPEKELLVRSKAELGALIDLLHGDKIAELCRQSIDVGKSFNDKKSAWHYLGDLEAEGDERIRNAKHLSELLLEQVQEANNISERLKNALQVKDIEVFGDNIKRLANDVPHAIQKIITATNKDVTIGSSRFF